MLHCRNRTQTIPLGNIQPLLEKVSGTLVFCRSTCMTEVTAIIETSYVFRHFWPLNNLHMSFVTTTSSLCFSPPLTCLATKWLLRVSRYNAYSQDCVLYLELDCRRLYTILTPLTTLCLQRRLHLTYF